MKKKTEKKQGKFKGFVKKHKVLSVLISLILVVAIVLGAFAATNGKSAKTSYSFVRTTTLSKGTLEDTISATGTVSSAKTSKVTTDLSYTVKTINVSVGDKVETGDVILTLSTDELESKIEKAKESLEKSKSLAQTSYDTAKAEYEDAKADYEDYKDELAEAKNDYLVAKTPYNKALSSVSSYQDAYDSALKKCNNAGAKYVEALSAYNTAVRNYKKGSITKSKLIAAAKEYMQAAQDYYGGCEKESYDVSETGTSSTATNNNSSSEKSFDFSQAQSGNAQISVTDEATTEAAETEETTVASIDTSAATASSATASKTSSSSTVTVSKTADEICTEVINKVYPLTGKKLTVPSGSNTLYKLTKRSEELKNAKSISNFDALESEYNSAKSAYEAAKQTYEQLENAVENAKTQLDNAADELEEASTSDELEELQDELDECSLKAEQSGTVTALNATVGSSANMESAATIQDLNSLQVDITIEEADINNVSLGMTCRISSDATDETFDGTLTQIDPSSENGSFGATVTINTVTTSLYIGMNASVDLIVSSEEDVYQVPIDAVGEDNGESFVYRQTGGSGTDMEFEKVTVTTGESNDYYIEISSTQLSEGDVIRSSADLTQGIETVSSGGSDSSDSSGGLFSGLFGGGSRGGGMPSGGMPSGDFPSRSSSDSSSGGGFTPPSGGMPGGNNG